MSLRAFFVLNTLVVEARRFAKAEVASVDKTGATFGALVILTTHASRTSSSIRSTIATERTESGFCALFKADTALWCFQAHITLTTSMNGITGLSKPSGFGGRSRAITKTAEETAGFAL